MIPQPNRTDNDYLKRRDKRDRLSTDAFGKKIADGTTNAVDIPSFYTYNPERLRLQQDGTRVDPEDIPTKFTDNEANYTLTPDAGESLLFQTAERPRYVVGYESVASTAAKLNSTLGDGDTVRIGLRDNADPENEAYFEINGNAENRLVIIKQGSEIKSQPFTFPDDIDETSAVRYEIQFNWYNVGRYKFAVTYTNDSEVDGQKEKNANVGEVVVDDDFATGDGVYHIFQEIDAATAGQELISGSFGYNVLGDVSETTRTKGSRLSGLSYDGSGEYEALAAVRLDADRGNVFTSFKDISVFPDGGGGELLIIVIEATETDASGFETPPQHSDRNSVIEQTTTVTEFPDQTGATVTQTTDPNGYQIGLAAYEEAGGGANTRSDSGLDVENKRPLYEDDVAILLYKADTATARTVNVTYFTEQAW